MKKLSLERLSDLFSAIADQQILYIPADESEGIAKFSQWQPGMTLTEHLNTVRSAKDLFFPQVENLVDFKISGKEIAIIENRNVSEDFVLFGVRACDCRSFDILDRVFLSEPVDSYYQERRNHVTVVTLACFAPEETCFCSVFDIDATEPGGDVTAWKTDDSLYLRANTEKGEALLATLPILEDCDDTAVKKAQTEARAILDRLPLNNLKLSDFDEEHTLEMFNAPVWSSLSESCLGCGTCTFVCPTCQCYDIREFDTGDTIRRFRCWDSCMYSDFTQMSAGQPRPTQLERFRQRFMHKLAYFPANNDGIFGCVGCGRCLQKCPIHMNIAKVIKVLGEEKK
jgi:sulfhydrogenase subunit beta (sulfur reductase)